MKACEEKSYAIAGQAFELWETELLCWSGKSKLAEAVGDAIPGGLLSNAS